MTAIIEVEGLNHLCWPRVELAGYDAAAVRLLLLWHAAAAWLAALGYAGCAGGCRRGAGAGVGAFCAQGHWVIMEPGAERASTCHCAVPEQSAIAGA